MSTADLKNKTVNLNDYLRKKALLASQASKSQVVKPTPAKVVSPISKAPKPVKTTQKGKADIADKKAKKLFRFLDDSGIEQPDKLLDFVRWYSLPRQLRKPETQEKLSEKIGIHKDTFVNWKRRLGFWDEVDLYSNNFFRSHAPDVYYALVQFAKRTGDPRAVKLYAQRFEGWSEKIRTEDETSDRELDPELKAQISHAIHNIGLSTIQKSYDKPEVENTLSTEQ